MKKVLVVSDNLELVSFFQSELQGAIEESNVQLTYAYTILNRAGDLFLEKGAVQIDMKDFSCVENIIKTYDLVLSLHCKQIFPANLVSQVECVNVHPGFNPYNRGWYPQVFSIINKGPIGATIHVMDAEVDSGPVIVQAETSILSSDTSLDVYNRVVSIEKKLLLSNIKKIFSGDYISKPTSHAGNYNSIKNFKDICALNLEAAGTLREHIDLLRALTHGEFGNAYFFDDNGQKVIVRISLERE